MSLRFALCNLFAPNHFEKFFLIFLEHEHKKVARDFVDILWKFK